jgi:hypothetical protein
MATPPPDPPAPWKRWWPPRSPRAVCKTPSARLELVAPVGFPAEWEQWPGTVRDTLLAAHPRAVVSADHRGCDLQRLRRPHKGQPGRPYRPDVPASAALRPGPHGRVLRRCGVLRCAVLLPALARVEDWIRLLPPPPPRCRAGLFDSDSGVTFYPGTFRCLGVGRDFSTAGWDGLNANSNSFYALGVGRDFSTVSFFGSSVWTCFYALGVGRDFSTSVARSLELGGDAPVSMPSVSGGTFRRMRF